MMEKYQNTFQIEIKEQTLQLQEISFESKNFRMKQQTSESSGYLNQMYFATVAIVNWFYSFIPEQTANRVEQKQPKSAFDLIIQLKLGSKRLQKESQKSAIEAEKFRLKAKQSLKKNNEIQAAVFAQQSMHKKQQALNLMKMSQKFQKLQMNMTNIEKNQQLFDSLQGMMDYVNQNTVDFTSMAQKMQEFTRIGDQMTINTKMMEEVMGQNDINVDSNVKGLLQGLKIEIAMDCKEQLDSDVIDINYPFIGTNVSNV